MRFAFAHKLSTYLTVGCAYFAIAMSGELGPLQLTLALFGIIGSWWWEPPRIDYDRWSLFWTILSGLVFAASVLLWLSGGEILLVGTHFLLFLLVAKLFARKQAKDYQQVYVLSFLMLVAGTVLNAGFSYGIFFLGYVVFSTWALILFHLRREMEENFLLKHSEKSSERVQVQRILNSKRIVGARFFIGTSLMSLVVFVSATILFLAIPRIGLGLFFPKRRDGVNLVGFDDKVKLGGHGRLKSDGTIVMRVKVDSSFEGRRAPEIHWRGVAFDKYENGSWSRSALAPRTEVGLDTDVDRRKTYVHMRYDHFGALPYKEIQRRLERGMRQEIYLEPMGNDVLFGASMPMTFELDGTDPNEKATVNDELRMNHGAGVKYVVYSRLDRPPVKVLRAAPTRLPRPGKVVSRPDEARRTYRRYLQKAKSMKQAERDRIRRLAEDITESAPTWYDKAVAVEAYLRTEYTYTLNMVAPPDGMDPVYFFLFERKKGHCEYFSSAMALLLREVDVPTRNVNGFLGGAWNEYDDYIAVRSGDAHSWVEVYFPGQGWVTFDPTPPGEASTGRGGTGLLDKLQRFMDTLRFKWFKWVIEYDLHQQLKMFNSIRDSLSGGKSIKRGFDNLRRWLRDNKYAAGGTLLALAVALFAWSRLRRKRRLLEPLGIDRQLSRHVSAVAGVYASTLARYERRGHKRATSATPREYAKTLQRQQVAGAQPFRDLTELYYAAIYGANDAPEVLPRARRLRDACQDAWKQRKRR